MKAQIIFSILLTFILYSCSIEFVNTKDESKVIYFCDAENTNNSTGKMHAAEDFNFTFNGYWYRTDEKAFSGTYSLKLSENQFGFGSEFQVLPDIRKYMISARIKGNTEKVSVVVSKDKFYESSNVVTETDKDGWKLISLIFTVPDKIETGELLKTYVWNGGNDTVYADDFTIYSVIEPDFDFIMNNEEESDD